jgi:ABC-type Fe3+ transport system permease subunit
MSLLERRDYSMKGIVSRLFMLLSGALFFLPSSVWAAGGGASALVVVADTRRVEGIMKYFSDLYNTNLWLFAVWAVVLTAAFGAVLGFGMDFIMMRTGLDLRSRKIVEH